MSRKRRNTSSAEPESPSPVKSQLVEYAPNTDSGRLPEQPRTSNVSGAAAAFPGLSDADDLFYGPAQDGIDYLRMVRTEAKSIPCLLTAAVAHEDVEYLEHQDHEGFFDNDEAYVATRSSPDESRHGIDKEQQLYYESILVRLNALRSTLRQTPPLDAIQALPESMPISFPTSSRAASETWKTYIVTHVPNPVQMACMDPPSVMELIKMVTKNLQRFLQSSSAEDVQRIGTWVWAMLARCPDRGQLGSEEISDLRACAKAADTTWRWLHNHTENVVAIAQTEVGEDDTNGHVSAAADDAMQADVKRDVQWPISPADSPMQGTHEGEPPQNKKRQIILDMIITVVGETYGQRDLLELRRAWT